LKDWPYVAMINFDLADQWPIAGATDLGGARVNGWDGGLLRARSTAGRRSRLSRLGLARQLRAPALQFPPAAIQPKGPSLSQDRFGLVVRGVLSPTHIASMEGFDTRYCADGHTHLVGLVPDQSTFNRLLKGLLEVDIELVSVNPGRDE